MTVLKECLRGMMIEKVTDRRVFHLEGNDKIWRDEFKEELSECG